MAHLEEVVASVPKDAGILIVTDGVFSMGGDIAKLPEIVEIAKKYGARVMVDDAHALGVIGEGGRGTASHFGLEDEVDIYMGTISKTQTSLGGYMAASKVVCDYVRHNSRPFIFSASITPASCASALAALRVLKAHPELVDRLQNIAEYMRNCLTENVVKIRMSKTPIIPIFTYDVISLLTFYIFFYDEGVYANSSIPPATAPNECLIRTSLMATHTKPLIDEATDIIAKVIKEN